MDVLKDRRIPSIILSALLLTSTIVILGNSADASVEDVSAASGTNRFVVWEDAPYKDQGKSEIFFKRSTDNGAVWLPTVNLSNNPGGSHAPAIAVSGANVYVAWLQANADSTAQDIFLRRSTDNSATWKAVIKITTTGKIGFTAPQIVSSGSNVYVFWEQSNGDIYLRRSADNGATWKSIVNISGNPGRSVDEQVAVSGSNVYVTWFQISADNAKVDVFFRKSSDNGATWGAKVNLSNSGKVMGTIFNSHQLTVSGSHIHVVWNQPDTTSGRSWTQIFIRSSDNSGGAWNPAKKVTSEDADFINPHVASSGSNVYLLFERVISADSGGQLTDIMFLVSRDNGVTWEPAVVLVESVGNATHTHMNLFALGSNVYVLWENGGYEFGDLFFRRSIDNGKTWGAISDDLNNRARRAFGIDVAASGSSVYLVWYHRNVGEIYLLRSINNGATWEPVKNISANAGFSRDPQIGS